MTAIEKKVFALGAAAGIVGAMLVAGVLAVREMRVAASEESKPTANSGTMPQAADRETQQGTQSGTTVELTPAEITAAGVQVAEVRTATLKTDIDAFGRVEQPESQLSAVSAWIGGRVDKLYVQYTGERVERGQPVAEVYSPEVATALDEYRLAQESRSQLHQSDDVYARQQADALVNASQRKLQLWGIAQKQIDAPAADGVPHVTIYANSSGTVVDRKVAQGQYVSTGETLFTLADLSQIWI